MATKHALLSFGILDADGNSRSFVDYCSYDDATATLSAISAYVSVEADKLDDIIDGQIVSATVTLELSVPGTVKSAPVAGSNIEETALLNFTTDSLDGLTYGQDIPTFYQNGYVNKIVNGGAQPVQDWVARMIATGGTFRSMDDRRAFNLTGMFKGRKTFRKR